MADNKSQEERTFFWIIATYAISITLLFSAAGVSILKGIPFIKFTRDPAALGFIHPLLGVLSNIGVLIWCSATAICLFAYVLTKKNADMRAQSSFLLYSGLLTLVLLLDDFFQFHDFLFPVYFHIPEYVVYLIYAAFTLFIVVRFFNFIMMTEYLILMIAFFLFGVSIIIDLLTEEPTLLRVLAEDGSKFIGIVSWCLYYSRLAMSLLASNHRRQ
jgi:hypothetical protein